MSDIVFLLSSERSGSNLLRVMMDSHSEFSAQHSPHLIKTFVPLLASYGSLQRSESLQQLAADMHQVVSIQLRDWPYVPELGEFVDNAKTKSFTGLLHSLYSLAAAKSDKQYSFIKDNGAIPYSCELASLFPSAKFVHLVRDPRDMALSWKKSPGHPGGVKDAARMWASEQNQALHFQSIMHDQGRLIRIHYECLVESPECELRRICAHIGVDFDSNMLEFHRGQEAKTSADAAIGWANLTKPVLTGNTGKYKSEFGHRQQKQIEKIAMKPMMQLGYQVEHEPTSSILDGITPGRLYRAARVALKQLFRGSAGIRELKQRTSRLKGLREIMVRMEKETPEWPQDNAESDSSDLGGAK